MDKNTLLTSDEEPATDQNSADTELTVKIATIAAGVCVLSLGVAAMPAIFASRKWSLPGGLAWSPVYSRVGVGVLIATFASLLVVATSKPKSLQNHLVHSPPRKAPFFTSIQNVVWHCRSQLLIAIWGLLGMWIADVLTNWPLGKYHVELGYLREALMALPIAALVSGLWDVKYHRSQFGQYVQQAEQRIASLSNLIGSTETDQPDEQNTTLFSVVNQAKSKVEALSTNTDSMTGGLNQLQAFVGSPTIVTQSGEGATLFDIVDRAKVQVDGLSKRIDAISNLMWLTEYRGAVQEEYRKASRRIISVADYWAIDDEWWVNGDWDQTPLLRMLKENKHSPDPVIFAGRVPWPAYEKDVTSDFVKNSSNAAEGGHAIGLPIQFEPPDFQRFLGVLWRLEVAHRLRSQKGESLSDRIRVVAASVPVMASVVDDEVFMILYKQGQEDQSRGTRLSGWPGLADAFEALLMRYMRHARSAREYIESALCLAVQASPERHINHAANEVELRACLETLGMDRWLSWSPDDPSLKPRESADKLALRAEELITTFFSSYCRSRMNYTGATFRHVLRDLL